MISFNQIQRSIINYVRSFFKCFYQFSLLLRDFSCIQYANRINHTYSDIITIREVSFCDSQNAYTKSIEKFVDLGTELLYFWTLKRVTSHFSTFSFTVILSTVLMIIDNSRCYRYTISNQMIHLINNILRNNVSYSIFLLSYISEFKKKFIEYIYICVEGKNVIYVELGVNKKRISNLKMRAVIKSSSFLT